MPVISAFRRVKQRSYELRVPQLVLWSIPKSFLPANSSSSSLLVLSCCCCFCSKIQSCVAQAGLSLMILQSLSLQSLRSSFSAGIAGAAAMLGFSISFGEGDLRLPRCRARNRVNSPYSPCPLLCVIGKAMAIVSPWRPISGKRSF